MDIAMNTEQIKSWIQQCIAGGWETFQDLHVDDIEPGFVKKSSWLQAGLDALDVSYGEIQSTSLNVLLAVPLASSMVRIGVNFKNIKEMEGQLSVTPPSLYVFDASAENWRKSLSETVIVQVAGIQSRFHLNYSEILGNDGDLVRCVYITRHP